LCPLQGDSCNDLRRFINFLLKGEIMAEVEKKQISIGDVFTNLTVVSKEIDSGRTRWKCRCVCGRYPIMRASVLIGGASSCGCIGGLRKMHSLSNTREYIIWKGIKGRCTNPNNTAFNSYGGRGIGISEDFLNNFTKWLDEVGYAPTHFHSIGRIDNNGDYTYGNMQWELPAQQAQNKTKYSSNKSGHSGVSFRTKHQQGFIYESWVVNWVDFLTGKRKTKNFSCNKFGYDEAKRLAIYWRNTMIELQKESGAYYTDGHGTDK
jgi:hypothetical protein